MCNFVSIIAVCVRGIIGYLCYLRVWWRRRRRVVVDGRAVLRHCVRCRYRASSARDDRDPFNDGDDDVGYTIQIKTHKQTSAEFLLIICAGARILIEQPNEVFVRRGRVQSRRSPHLSHTLISDLGTLCLSSTRR